MIECVCVRAVVTPRNADKACFFVSRIILFPSNCQLDKSLKTPQLRCSSCACTWDIRSWLQLLCQHTHKTCPELLRVSLLHVMRILKSARKGTHPIVTV